MRSFIGGIAVAPGTVSGRLFGLGPEVIGPTEKAMAGPNIEKVLPSLQKKEIIKFNYIIFFKKRERMGPRRHDVVPN